MNGYTLPRRAAARCGNYAMSHARTTGACVAIGRAFRRDHTTVMHAVERYQQRVTLSVAEAEMRVFRALIPASHRIVTDRIAGVVRLAGYRPRRVR